MEIKHGTHRAYGVHKCRCEICKEFRRQWRARENQKPAQKAKHNERQKRYHAERMASDPEYREHYREKKRKSAARMRANPEKWARTLARARMYSHWRRDLIQEIKLERGCVDCGYREHPEALDFDHIGEGKHFIVSKLKTHSLEAIMEEIDKCEVVCANCHRIRTYNRRNGIVKEG